MWGTGFRICGIGFLGIVFGLLEGRGSWHENCLDLEPAHTSQSPCFMADTMFTLISCPYEHIVTLAKL